ncbi:hypothetical protein J6590_008633 [Homalodisca vitripennis]|nr:hypothetical protein J6590_008633 [Homalodisca vitripennis]
MQLLRQQYHLSITLYAVTSRRSSLDNEDILETLIIHVMVVEFTIFVSTESYGMRRWCSEIISNVGTYYHNKLMLEKVFLWAGHKAVGDSEVCRRRMLGVSLRRLYERGYILS